MRLMAGVLAGHPFTSRADRGRVAVAPPDAPGHRAAGPDGGRIEAVDGHPPLTIHGADLHAITHEPDVPSAQVKSAVLLAGLHASGTTTVIEPARTRDHTERALLAFGGQRPGRRRPARAWPSPAARRWPARTLAVPGDFSSAAFWMVAAAACPGFAGRNRGVGLNPTRTDLIGVLRRFGARVEFHQTSSDAGEPVGTIIVEGDRIGRVDIAPDEVPGLIDELPAIAALAGHGGEVSVRGAAELRVKESDRIAVLVAGFRALGIPADERPDGFVAGEAGTTATGSGQADAHGDHRMAMAFAIAALAGRIALAHPRRRLGRHLLSGLLRDARPARRVKADKVYLVGFMGAGKTSVGRALARRLDWQPVDIDELIEQREHLPVSEIFARHGEPYFRAAEREVLTEQLPTRHVVVATGRRDVRGSRRTGPSSTTTACRSGSMRPSSG